MSVPFENIQITSPFWQARQAAIRQGSIPAIYDQMKKTGRWECMKMEWRPGMPNKPHRFWDSDVAKWLEAACYSLVTHPDPELDKLVEEAVDIIRSGQQEDGYLDTYYTVVEQGKRWTNIAWSHEMYDCGHLLEAALAYTTYSKSTRLLDPILKYVNHIRSVFGTGVDQKHGYPGHQELELALLKAHEHTHDSSLLDLASYFIEERGQIRADSGHYYDVEAGARGEAPFVGPGRGPRYSYCQADRPIREVKSLKGHSVRAMYWLTAVAHLARVKKDESLVESVRQLWGGMTARKMYVTGGLGAMPDWEGFGPDFFLPNETGYLETCAAIGLVLFAHQMLLLDPWNPEYSNTMELALYNAVMVGVSLDGKSFFYDNPLATLDKYASRSEWFEVSCCPPNVARLFGSLGKYIYTVGEDDTIHVHLYISSEAELTLRNGDRVRVIQESDAPWNGGARFKIESVGGADVVVKLHLRKPLGARSMEIFLPSEKQGSATNKLISPNEVLVYNTSTASTITVNFTYPITQIRAHPLNLANAHSTTFSRGPFIYCAETVDNPDIPDLRAIRLPRDAVFEEVVQKEGAFDEMCGEKPVFLRTDDAMVLNENEEGHWVMKKTRLTLIPLFMWGNRGKSDMRVWIPQLVTE